MDPPKDEDGEEDVAEDSLADFASLPTSTEMEDDLSMVVPHDSGSGDMDITVEEAEGPCRGPQRFADGCCRGFRMRI